MGFEYFYGFMGGETDQWTPYLVQATIPKSFPWIGKPGYNLTTDMADEAIKYMQRSERSRARQAVLPLLCARRHALAAPAEAKEWIDKFKGKFDMGYEKLRDADFCQPEDSSA